METLSVNGREIPVAVVRSRRARRYVLRLRADGQARLTVPRHGSAAEAWQFARRQNAWLERQLRHLATRPTLPEKWFAGTEIFFRGERIKIETTANALRVGGETIPLANAAGIADLDLRPVIEKYLRALADAELRAQTLARAAQHQLTVQRVTIRSQRSRWGSCSSRGVISLNWRLIQTPPFVRDYIILHELMHLRQMNHSARFWNEVAQVCPNYQEAKLWLKKNPGLLPRQ